MKSTFLKDLLSIGLSKFAIITFSLGTSIITARWLGPKANGIIAALTVYPSLFLTFGSLGISQSVTHFVGKEKFSVEDIKTSIIQIWVFTSIVSLLICFVLIRYFSNSGENIYWIFFAIMPVPFTLFNKYNTGIFLGKNQISTYNRINWLPLVIGFFSIILLVIIFPFFISGALLAAVVGPFILFIFLLFKNNFIQSFSFKINWKVINSLFSLGIVYALSLLVINLNYKVDIILMDKLSSSFQLGIYSKGVSITNLLWEIPMLLSTIVFARSANAKNGLQFSYKTAQLLRLSLIAVGLASIILFFLAKYIIIIMYGEEFIKSTKVLQYLMPGVLLLTVFKVLNGDLAGKGKPWIAMKAMLPSVLLNIILNIFLIPIYGANGSAISSTISYSLAAILFLKFYSIEVHIPIKEILNFSKSDFDPIHASLKKYINR